MNISAFVGVLIK